MACHSQARHSYIWRGRSVTDFHMTFFAKSITQKSLIFLADAGLESALGEEAEHIVAAVALDEDFAAARRAAAAQRALQGGGYAVDFVVGQREAAYYGGALAGAPFLLEHYVESPLRRCGRSLGRRFGLGLGF